MDLSKRDELLPREVRQWGISDVEVRADDTGTLGFRGVASVTEHPYTVRDAFGEFAETVARTAFDKTLAENPDVVFLTNHGGLSMARTTAGTLTLGSDDRGLTVDADLDGTRSDVRDMASALDRGDVDQMSFAFRVVRQEWSEDYSERRILEVNLHRGDVSVVNFGANPVTFGALRALGDGFGDLDDALQALRDGTADEGAIALVARAHGVIGDLLAPAPAVDAVALAARVLQMNRTRFAA